jgi:multiple sugar transport system permease protein
VTPARDQRLAAVLLGPALLALLAVAGYPIVAATWLSLNRVIVIFDERRWVGLDNYAFMLTDARFWSALGHTAYFSVVAVSIELALGLGFALLLASRTPGRGLLRATLLIPWAVPTVVSAQLWAWLFSADTGLLIQLLPGPDNWLGTAGYAMHAAILVDVWKTTPFVTLLVWAGLSTIPRELYEAAELDGASRLRIFASVTLPLLKPIIAVTLVLRSLDAFRVFDAVYVLTGGGPGNTTETLSIYAYKMLMRSGDFGYGSALAVTTFACIALLSWTMISLFARRGALE